MSYCEDVLPVEFIYRAFTGVQVELLHVGDSGLGPHSGSNYGGKIRKQHQNALLV